MVVKSSSQPVITKTSGSFSNNKIVHIFGRNFSSKIPAAPMVWADFSTDINPSIFGCRTSWDEIQNLKRITNLPEGAGTNNGVVGIWNSVTAPARSFSFSINHFYYQKIYQFGKRYYDFPTTTNQKMWRLNNLPGQMTADPVITYGNHEWLAHLNECDTENPDRFSYIQYNHAQWMTEEFIWQFSGGSGLRPNGQLGAGGTGIMEYIRDGKRIFRQENQNNCTNNQVELRYFDNFTPSNIPTDTPATGSKVYMTFLYGDTVYNRVMIGNQATLKESIQREIQVPQTWSDSVISIVINQGTFATDTMAYLFVVDAHNVSSSGIQLTFGKWR